ncbi:MAG: thiol peroxidase [Helicobacter sp.]|nr:thiol peroxidase [Helicobacter sp.]
MQITLKGAPHKLSGTELKAGTKAPNFTLNSSDGKKVSLSDFKGKVVILSVIPDINTPVCDKQTREFNEKAANLAQLITISKNTPEEFAKWCGASNISNLLMLSDPDREFAKAYGVLIEDLNILTRAIFVICQDGNIAHVEIVPEVVNEPNYESALKSVREHL